MLARMMAKIDSQLEKMEACLSRTEATDLEANSEEIKTEVVHEEVPKEKAIVKTVIALKRQHKDWHLAVRCRSQLKKWTQGNCVSWKNMPATCRGMTCCPIPAWCKGQCYKRGP